MKHLKLTLFSFIILFISTSVFVSCSSENETTIDKTSNKNVDTFLKLFYSKEYSIGQTTKVKTNSQLSTLSRTAIVEDTEITEIFVGNDTEARGYIITNKNTGEFLYFIDVDRDTYTLTSLDVMNSDQKIFNNIDEINNYFSTNEFDFIEIAMDDTIYTGTDERKFWGWQTWKICDESTGMAYVYETYYVLGIPVKDRPKLGLGGGQLIEPCAGGALAD